jgi:hypothetical protein
VLNSFVKTFDYADFEKKLRHYFTDAAPIYADIVLTLNDIYISYNKKSVHVSINNALSVKENISYIIKCCEDCLYPKMLQLVEKGQFGVFTTIQMKDMLLQGMTLDQIHKKQNKKILNYFIITRFNTAKNTIDFKEESTGNIFRAFLNRPLITSRDLILQFEKAGSLGMNDLYYFIMDNSRIEELEGNDA